MSTIVQDVRYGLRLLRKSPGFTAVAVAALALGIGANTAIFSVVNAVLLRPLPYPDAGRIGMLWENSPGQGWTRLNTTGPNYIDYKEKTRSFQDLALMEIGSGTLTGSGEPIQAPGLRVTTNFFGMIGKKPLLGRDFLPSESWQTRVAIISYGTWVRLFGRDPAIIGRRAVTDGIPYTLIGVMPPDLWLPVPADIFVPWADGDLRRARRDSHDFVVIARLKPGITYAAASADVNSVMREIGAAHPQMKDWHATVVPMQEHLVEGVRPALLVLLGSVGLVLLIACTNIANLLLARATGRVRETAIRTALGARRGRLIRQWMTETLVLGLLGGAIGLLLALWGVDLLERLVPPTIRLTDSTAEMLRPHLVVDGAVLAFTAAIAIITGFFFGVAPALAASRSEALNALKEGGRNSSARHSRRARDWFVVAEVALALMLLICAGLTIKSFWNLQHVMPGFTAQNLLVMETELPTDSRYQKAAEQTLFYERVLANLNALPGAQSAAISSAFPLEDHDAKTTFRIEGRPLPPSGQPLPASYRSISEAYFSTLGIPLRRGRLFTPQDRAGKPPVAIIDEALAARYWPAGVDGAADPIGQKIAIGSTVLEIVGIAGAVRSGGLDKLPDPTLYVSYRQFPDSHVSIAVRHPDPIGMVNAVKRAVYAVDREQPLFRIRTMNDVVSASQSATRFTLVALAVFAGVAIALAGVGIYGVISYAVAQRKAEIGVRIALGAGTGEVLRMVVGQGMVLTAIGVTIGLAGAAAASRVLAALLFGVSPTDPAIFAGTALVLAAVAFTATWIPARRAARIDPIVSLRYE